MRVRNLKQYIESIPGSGYNISELGTHREPFLTYMGGHYQNIDQVKNLLRAHLALLPMPRSSFSMSLSKMHMTLRLTHYFSLPMTII